MSDGPAPAHKSGGPQGREKPDPLIGRVIAGRFKIVSLIARGGMGKVYRAEQSPLGRVCAIKVLNPNYNGDADPEFHRRFFREASITSKIMHPNSVTIFDYGRTDDDIYFMAMEYLEGKTLHMALREGGVMAELRAGRIAAQICRALREAHKLGVIHRDLKPANIFLTRPSSQAPDIHGTIPPPSEEDEDFVKVLDFGLVKHLSERPEEQLTQTGLFMGSPKYMAPEQIQGGHVDERTDIYSLGIILYEMLAGKVPFERATSVNILMAHVGEPPPPMREVNPNLICSPAFEELIMCCIAKDPNERFASMDQVLHAIRRAHGGSLTGQVAALTASGQYRSVGGSTPPPPGVAGYGSVPPPPLLPGAGARRAAGGTGTWPPPAHRSYPPPSGRSYPPPAVSQSQPPQALRHSGGMVAATGPNLPVGVTGPNRPIANVTGPNPRVDRARSAASPAHGTPAAKPRARAITEPEPPRSKLSVAVGILAAAVIGGGLGMLAFKWTAPALTPEPTTPSASASASASSPAATPSSSPSPSPPASSPAAMSSTAAGTAVPPATSAGVTSSARGKRPPPAPHPTPDKPRAVAPPASASAPPPSGMPTTRLDGPSPGGFKDAPY